MRIKQMIHMNYHYLFSLKYEKKKKIKKKIECHLLQILLGTLRVMVFFFIDDLGEDSFEFRFTAEGYGDIGYNILNFRQNPSTGQYEYAKVT